MNKLTIAIGRMHPGATDRDDAAGGGDYEQGFEAAAEDILSAVKSGDAKLLASALHDFFSQCEAMPHDEG